MGWDTEKWRPLWRSCAELLVKCWGCACAWNLATNTRDSVPWLSIHENNAELLLVNEIYHFHWHYRVQSIGTLSSCRVASCVWRRWYTGSYKASQRAYHHGWILKNKQLKSPYKSHYQERLCTADTYRPHKEVAYVIYSICSSWDTSNRQSARVVWKRPFYPIVLRASYRSPLLCKPQYDGCTHDYTWCLQPQTARLPFRVVLFQLFEARPFFYFQAVYSLLMHTAWLLGAISGAPSRTLCGFDTTTLHRPVMAEQWRRFRSWQQVAPALQLSL